MTERSLDIPWRQCFIDYFNDPNGFRWHGRILFFASKAGDGRWIGCTPDHDVCVVNFADHRVVAVARNCELPQYYAGEMYYFDEFDDGELDDLVRQARELAEMMGYLAPADPDADHTGRWRLSDPAYKGYGDLVPNGVLSDSSLCVMRGDSGLLQINGEWTTMQRVNEPDLAKWKEAKSNAQRDIDRRILPLARDSAGMRCLAEHDAIAMWRDEDDREFPLRGPKMAKDMFMSLRAAGQTLLQHHLDFVRISGVPPKGAIAREHAALTDALRYLVTWDMIDVTACVGAELITRRIFVLEAAVARNPKAPDWEGLDMVQSHTLTEEGGAVAAKFAAWVANVQKDEAISNKVDSCVKSGMPTQRRSRPKVGRRRHDRRPGVRRRRPALVSVEGQRWRASRCRE